MAARSAAAPCGTGEFGSTGLRESLTPHSLAPRVGVAGDNTITRSFSHLSDWSSVFARYRILRAFLVEEQKIVKKMTAK